MGNLNLPYGGKRTAGGTTFVDLWNELFDLQKLSAKQQSQFAFFAKTDGHALHLVFNKAISNDQVNEHDKYELS